MRGRPGRGGGRDWAGGREKRVAAVSQSGSVDLSDQPLAGLDGATWRGEKLPWVEGAVMAVQWHRSGMADKEMMLGERRDRVAPIYCGGQAVAGKARETTR